MNRRNENADLTGADRAACGECAGRADNAEGAGELILPDSGEKKRGRDWRESLAVPVRTQSRNRLVARAQRINSFTGIRLLQTTSFSLRGVGVGVCRATNPHMLFSCLSLRQENSLRALPMNLGQ